MSGSNWGSWRNDLFVSTLKESDVRPFEISDTGNRADARSTLFNTGWGRLRAAVRAPGGDDLYITSSNGNRTDRVIRIRAD